MSGRDNKPKMGFSAAGLMRGLAGLSDFKQGSRIDDND